MATHNAKKLGLNATSAPDSVKEVIATLTQAGFDAYIVGGGVRDALLGFKPKDFDAVTNATPQQIKQVFGKRCRIIGRRFQLAHVFSGPDMIEVATFRAPPKKKASTSQSGMIVRDNNWGSIKQDFVRRDFTINALYYQPQAGKVIDFCGSLQDIEQKKLRLLGDAQTRVHEDPVRLLRALRFKAKLGFEFDEALAQRFNDQNWALLDQVSPHRLYDETQKMFTGGYLEALLPLLFEYGAIEHLLAWVPKRIEPLVAQVAHNTDKRIQAAKSINPAFFYAALLWSSFCHYLNKRLKNDVPYALAASEAGNLVINKQRKVTAIPKYAEYFIKDTWALQPLLIVAKPEQILALLHHKRFRAAFDFLHLREKSGDNVAEMGTWWLDFQELDAAEQVEKIHQRHQKMQSGQIDLQALNSLLPVDFSTLDDTLLDSVPVAIELPDGSMPILSEQPRRQRNRREQSSASPERARRRQRREPSQSLAVFERETF